jgi:hypothetical protein
MLLVAVLSLLLVSTLTFLFKWQADKAMIGIIIHSEVRVGTNEIKQNKNDI